jgi:hypothetical protein
MATDDLPFQRSMKQFTGKVLGLLGAALMACVSLSIGSDMVHKEFRYMDQSVLTTAEVIQKERYLAGGRHAAASWQYRLTYRYKDSAGRRFEGEAYFPESVWEQREDKHHVTIVYLQDEPSESRQSEGPPFGNWYRVVFGACCCGGWGLACSFAALAALFIPAEK